MYLVLVETERYTRINDTEDETVQAAADRLVARDRPGHYAGGLDNDRNHGRSDNGMWNAEVCRAVDGMTMHTGETVHFRVIDDKQSVARIFEDVGGYHICSDADDHLTTSPYPHTTKAAALRAAARNGYTHAVGSGTTWDGIRRIPAKYRDQ